MQYNVNLGFEIQPSTHSYCRLICTFIMQDLTLLKASLIFRSVLNHVFKPNDLGQMLG